MGLFKKKSSENQVGITSVFSILIASIVGSTAHSSEVSLKNGNFYMGNRDLSYSGGIDFQLLLTYNSKSSFNGMFGLGNGSEFSTYITPSVSAIVVRESGGGATNRFLPSSLTADKLEKLNKDEVNLMAEGYAKEVRGLGGAAIENYKKRLFADKRFRAEEWERLAKGKFVTKSPIPDGVVFKSNEYSSQTITKVKDTFVRKYDTGRVEVFNNAGNLMQIFDRNKNFIRFTYDSTGKLNLVQDNLHRSMKFFYDSSGHVVKVVGDKTKSCEYQYEGFTMTRRKNALGEVYEYVYSKDGRYNLKEIRFPDKTNMKIDYNSVAQGESVKSVKERDGTTTEYEYSGDGVEGFKRTTAVVVKNNAGKAISSAKYEYYDKVKSSGDRYTYKMVSEVDGEKIEAVYNECCGLPLTISRNGQQTTFEYDANGHVTKKATPTEITELQYHPTFHKVTKVTRFPKEERDLKKIIWSTYQYDNNGNLAEARNSSGQAVKILYETTSGQIKAMVDQAKRRLEFVYNDANRPVEIRDPAVGKIKVQYNDAGDVIDVNRQGKREISSQITSAFKNLMDLVNPAGVSLTAP